MEKFLIICRGHGISPDQAFTLCSFKSLIDLEKTIKSFYDSLEYLILDGFLKGNDGENESEYVKRFQLTEKGETLMKKLDACFIDSKTLEPKSSLTPLAGSNNSKADLDTFVEDYRAFFPSGTIGSKPYKSTPKDIRDRLKWFRQNYPELYDYELMIDATKAYHYEVDRTNGHRKTAGYFIKKQGNDKIDVSVLAEWCQLIKDDAISDNKKVTALLERYDIDGML